MSNHLESIIRAARITGLGFLVVLALVACDASRPGPPTPTRAPVASTLTPSPFPVITPPPTSTPLPQEGGIGGQSDTALSTEPTATPTATPEPITYTVQAGDTLIKIATDFGFSELSPLLEANNLPDENALSLGQVLIIPRQSSTDASNTVSYRVEAGDTFASIAAKFGISSENLQRANPDIEPTSLQVDQELKVPWDGVHVVGPGDTLSTIAEQYQVNYDELIQANNDVLDFTDLDLIYPGTELVIPQEGGEVVDCSPQPPRATVVEYTVQQGERLFCLARKFSLSETTLLYANPHLIGEGGLTAGTKIYVPPGDGALYTVTETDVENEVTLEDIALWYSAYGGLGRIVDWEGNEVSLPLAAGQQLFVPGADLLAGDFQSEVLVAASEPPPPPAGETSDAGAGSVAVVPEENTAVPEALTKDLSYRIWYSEFAQGDPGYCNLVPGSGWSGTLTWPIDSRNVPEGRGFRPGHRGIDIKTPEGTPVKAAESGVVVWSGYSTFGGGIIIILSHGNDWRTYYAHLNESYVGCGQTVGKGAVIGASGKTGTSWYHLHFEVQNYNVPYDPLTWLP